MAKVFSLVARIVVVWLCNYSKISFSKKKSQVMKEKIEIFGLFNSCNCTLTQRFVKGL